MLARGMAAALLCLGVALGPVRGEELPFVAYVTSGRAFHRSGPGDEYYRTGTLRKGDAVEIYAHDASGWCAVRPPEGSFSWVRVADIKPLEGNIAVVTSDGATARVGSLVGPDRDVEQVRLQHGEELEILEDQAEAAEGGSPGWLRISPPSGEFRYVAAADLGLEPPGEPADPPVDAGDATEAPPPNDPPPSTTDTPPTAWRRRGSAPPADSRPSTTPSATPGIRPGAATTTPPAVGASAEHGSELDAIERDLVRIAAQEPADWSFDDLSTRVEAALGQARTSEDATRARALMKRITRLEDIQRRHLALAEGVLPPPDTHSAMVDRPLDPPVDSLSEPAPIDGRFDGVGTLTRVVSDKVGAPQFALVDESGAVVEYVTAAPGVNLSRYLGRRVGITGLRGRLPESGANHVTAQRVAALEALRDGSGRVQLARRTGF